MKALFVFVLSLVSITANAESLKYCGKVEVFGVEYYNYARVVDNKYNPRINGKTKDPNQVVKYLNAKTDGTCLCVKGTIAKQTLEGYEIFNFTQVDSIWGCSNGPKLAGK
ncbi:MAG: hypothetical protein K2Q26_11660 [Bdellovibrionales bacterium]|nr:hypothetical protein [Bdellovibrionales bacterium]